MRAFRPSKYVVSSVALVACLQSHGALAFEPGERLDEVFVTASPMGSTVGETIAGTSVVTEEELARRLQNSIGETLRLEPGVSSTFFGPGASRPIIRGLGGDRVRVLDSGIGSIDASATSPDHAVAVEPATAERVEIVRGSGTLLYGSSAAGGVVNVISNKIPKNRPEDGIDGAVRYGGSTVDDGTEMSGAVDWEIGKLGSGAIVVHGEGFFRDADPYDIPGFAESARLRASEEEEGEEEEGEEEEVYGTVENTAFESKGGAGGISWVFEGGFFGISGTAIDTEYGVPGEHHHHEEEEGEEEEEEEEEEEGVTIDLKQRRLDLHGEIAADLGVFERVNVRLGYADYEHKEFEGPGEVGTVFTNEGVEGRFELIDKPFNLFNGEVNGAVGLHVRLRDFSAIGEEAFVQPTSTEQIGIFALKEYTTGPYKFELSGRYENTSHEVDATGVTREFDAVSLASGVGYNFTESLFAGATVYRTERAPAVEELFSDGPHLATQAFEVGDPDLDKEIALGVEATLRYAYDRFAFTINGFYTSYEDFIFEIETGLEEDELPVFQFVAEDATFQGFEAEAEAELFKNDVIDIHGSVAIDYVSANTNIVGNDNIPRIPPLSTLVGLELHSKFVDVRGEYEMAQEQDDVADFELPTDGYDVFNAFLTVRPFASASGISLNVAGTNLTDEEVRLHSSFIKDLAPLPGRNVKFSVRAEF